ncbi:hypothetical protein C5167_027238 [Papaver somniferum]|nr:hypothetical protein C5167_027238 [Papaver somniferum]
MKRSLIYIRLAERNHFLIKPTSSSADLHMKENMSYADIWNSHPKIMVLDIVFGLGMDSNAGNDSRVLRLTPVQTSSYTFLQAVFDHAYPVALLDEEKVLSIGRQISAVGISSSKDGVPQIKSSQDLPCFLTEKTKDQLVVDMAFSTKCLFWGGLILGSLSIGILGYATISANFTVGGETEERMMMTGLHSVCDIFCVGCRSIVGWKYVVAQEKSQRYKEGKFILERFQVLGPEGTLYYFNNYPEARGSEADDMWLWASSDSIPIGRILMGDDECRLSLLDGLMRVTDVMVDDKITVAAG